MLQNRGDPPRRTTIKGNGLTKVSPFAAIARLAMDLIGATRFELATSRSRTVRSIQAELRPVNACFNDLSDPAGSVNRIKVLRRRR